MCWWQLCEEHWVIWGLNLARQNAKTSSYEKWVGCSEDEEEMELVRNGLKQKKDCIALRYSMLKAERSRDTRVKKDDYLFPPSKASDCWGYGWIGPGHFRSTQLRCNEKQNTPGSTKKSK